MKFNTYGRQFGAGGTFGGLKFGATSGRPPVQEFINKGYISGKLCEARPKSVTQKGPYEYVDKTNYPTWVQGPYYDSKGAGYIHYLNNVSGDQFWLYSVKSIPCGGNADSDTTLKVTTGDEANAMLIQKALNARGAKDSSGKALVVDGAIGPKTCSAAAAFQASLNNDREDYLAQSGLFGAAFFNALGFVGEEWVLRWGAMCSSHDPDTGMVIPEPIEIVDPDPVPDYKPPVTPAVPDEPVPLVEDQPVILAGFSWKTGLLMAGLLIGGALFLRSRKGLKGKGYERKAKRPSKRKAAKRARRR